MSPQHTSPHMTQLSFQGIHIILTKYKKNFCMIHTWLCKICFQVDYLLGESGMGACPLGKTQKLVTESTGYTLRNLVDVEKRMEDPSVFLALRVAVPHVVSPRLFHRFRELYEFNLHLPRTASTTWSASRAACSRSSSRTSKCEVKQSSTNAPGGVIYDSSGISFLSQPPERLPVFNRETPANILNHSHCERQTMRL